MRLVTGLLHAIALIIVGLRTPHVVAEPIPFTSRATTPPSVDLGYSVYQGTFDAASGVNSFKGYGYPMNPVSPLLCFVVRC